MRLRRRNFLRLAAGAAALPVLPRPARADTYPSRPVHILCGFAPGGAADTVARLTAEWLSEQLGQQFVVDNRPGAGTNIATEAVVQAAPDGYTLLLVTGANAINTTLYQHLNFDFLRDTAAVAGVIRVPQVMVVTPQLPAKTVPEFIAYAKANPGKINMGSGGVGSTLHVAGELFKMMAGVNLVHVPYRGDAPALVDLMGGQIQVMFDLTAAALPFIKAGKIRGLAVTSAARTPSLPDLPPIGDSCPATRRRRSKASPRRRTRRSRSSTSSTKRSMRASPTKNSRRGWPTWAATACRARPPTSPKSSPTKPKNGARWSSSPASRPSD